MTLPSSSSSSAAPGAAPTADRLIDGALARSAVGSGEEHPRQGDVLELAQVAEVVVGGQAPLARPGERFAQLALREPDPCPQRRDRPHVGEEVADVEALRLVEQVERAVQISVGLPYPGHRDPRAVGFCGSPRARRSSLLRCRCCVAAAQVVALAVRARSSRRACPPCPANRPACSVRAARPARRCASRRQGGPATPDVRQGDRATEGVGEVPGPPQPRHAVGVRRCAGVEVAARPGREPRAPLPMPAEVRRRRRSSSARRACRYGAGHVAPDQGERGAVHRDRAGRRRNSSSSTTTILPRGRGRRAATARRPAAGFDALELAASQQRAGEPDAEHRPDADHLVGQRLQPAEHVASCRLRAWPASPARSGPPPARSLRAASAWRIASDGSPFCSNQSLARRCSSGTRRAARPAGALAARRRRGGGSGTTGDGRRAGPGTGSPDRAPRAWPCRRRGR